MHTRYCEKNSDWFTMFAPNIKKTFLPYVATCWIETISLDYNVTSHWANDPQGTYIPSYSVLNGVKLGVQSRFTDYGGVDSIAYVDDDHQIGIWSEAIALLVKAGT